MIEITTRQSGNVPCLEYTGHWTTLRTTHLNGFIDSVNKGDSIKKGTHLSKETKEKLSQSLKGRTLSEEHKRKIGRSHAGKCLSEETKRKISDTQKRKITSGEIVPFNKGKRFSESHRKHLSEACKGRPSAFKGKNHTVETRNKMALVRRKYYVENPTAKKLLQKPKSEESKKKQSEVMRSKYLSGELLPWAKGKTFSTEHKKNISLSRKGKPSPFKGKHHTLENKLKQSETRKRLYQQRPELKEIAKRSDVRLKISLSKLGKPRPDSVREILSNLAKKRIGALNPFYGKHHSAASKLIMREKALDRIMPTEGSSIELKVADELRKRRVNFKQNIRVLDCKPDMFIEPNICIFCDGDFFHGWAPSFNKIKDRPYEKIKKIQATIERDKRINLMLSESGFKVIRIWEHDINNDVSKCVDSIMDAMGGR